MYSTEVEKRKNAGNWLHTGLEKIFDIHLNKYKRRI